MQCKTLKQAISDSRSRLGESSTGIKLRFGNDVRRMRVRNKENSPTFVSRDAATLYCLKSEDMAVSPVLINGVKGVPTKCAGLQYAILAKHQKVMNLPLVTDFFYNIEDAAQVVRSEVKRAAPVLREFQEAAQEVNAVAGANVRQVPLLVQNLQRRVAQSVQNRSQQQSQDKDSSFDPTFVHSCHECDNCQTFPIRGYRWRAVRPKLTGDSTSANNKKEVNLPDTAKSNYTEMDVDFCHPCYMKWRAQANKTPAMQKLPSGVKFYSTQLDEDRNSHLLKHSFPVTQTIEEEVVFKCDSEDDSEEEEKSVDVAESDDCVANEQVNDEGNDVEEGYPSNESFGSCVDAAEALEKETQSEDGSAEEWTKMDESASEDDNETEASSIVEEVIVCEFEEGRATEEQSMLEEMVVCEPEVVQAGEPTMVEEVPVFESEVVHVDEPTVVEEVIICETEAAQAEDPIVEEEVIVCDSEDEAQSEIVQAEELAVVDEVIFCESEDEAQLETATPLPEEEEVLVSVEETKKEEQSDDGSSSGEESEWSLMSEGSSPSPASPMAMSTQRTTTTSAQPSGPSSGEDFYRWFMSS